MLACIKTSQSLSFILALTYWNINMRLLYEKRFSDFFPLASKPTHYYYYFNISLGEIHLRRNLTELLAMAKPNEPIDMTVIAEEIIPDSGRLVSKSSSRSSSSAQDNNSRTMGKITFWFGKGSSFGPAAFTSDKWVHYDWIALCACIMYSRHWFSIRWIETDFFHYLKCYLIYYHTEKKVQLDRKEVFI